jgi:hypothetical protein
LKPGTHIASHRARPSPAYPHADDLLFDLTRVTGAAPLELGYFDGHGGSPEGDANVELRVRGAVSACARVNKLGGREAVISMNWDPWLWKWSSPTTGTQTDPASTLREADELTFYEGQAVMYDQLIQKANKALGANVRVGAVLIDSESFVWPGYPDAIPGMRYWAAVARKNMLMWNATRKLYPAVAAANVSYYSRGGVNWRPDLNATECSRGRDAVRDLDLPRGYCMATDVALDPAFDKRSPFTVTLYQIQEPEYTRQAFLHTAAAAKTFGVVDGAVIPYPGGRLTAQNGGFRPRQMQCAHDPMEAPQRFLDLYDAEAIPNQVEYAFSSVIDEGLANVTAALKAKGMWANTLLVVSSDNGGPAFSDQHAASNFPLRGGKYTFFEGGVRVNAFVTGGLLPAAMRGTNISAPIHICDWYATFCGLAGVPATDDATGVPALDSIGRCSAASP